MKISYMLLLCAATTFSVSSCGNHEKDELTHNHSHHGTAEDIHGGEGHDHAGHNHDHIHHNTVVQKDEHKHSEDPDIIMLKPESAERFGVVTAKVEKHVFGRVVKVSGSIMAAAEDDAVVVAPTSGILTIAGGMNVGSEVVRGSLVGTIKAEGVTGGDVNRAAKAELDAARLEWKRIEALYADRLVTQSQYNAARAAFERAQATYSTVAADGRAIAPISGVVTSLQAKTGQYVEVGTPIANVAASTRLTLRADLPSKHYSFLPQIKDARVAVPYSDALVTLSSLDSHRVNVSAASAAASAGYIPVVYNFRNDGSLLPGTAVEVYLIGSDSHEALLVPRTALSEQQGNYFVYAKLDADCYRKVPVTVGGTDGQNVEILSGLSDGETIVAEGVTTIRLAQSAGSIPSGHSHSH